MGGEGAVLGVTGNLRLGDQGTRGPRDACVVRFERVSPGSLDWAPSRLNQVSLAN